MDVMRGILCRRDVLCWHDDIFKSLRISRNDSDKIKEVGLHSRPQTPHEQTCRGKKEHIQGTMSISNGCSTEFEECFRFPRKQTLGHRCQCRRLLGSDNTCQGVREAGMGTGGSWTVMQILVL